MLNTRIPEGTRIGRTSRDGNCLFDQLVQLCLVMNQLAIYFDSTQTFMPRNINGKF